MQRRAITGLAGRCCRNTGFGVGLVWSGWEPGDHWRRGTDYRQRQPGPPIPPTRMFNQCSYPGSSVPPILMVRRAGLLFRCLILAIDQHHAKTRLSFHHASETLGCVIKRKRFDHRPHILQNAEPERILGVDGTARQAAINRAPADGYRTEIRRAPG
jgi:hypothetical protein